MTVSIRAAAMGDVGVLAGFLSELFAIEDDFRPDIKVQQAGLRLLLADGPKSGVFVAESGLRTIGMVTGQLVVSTAAGGRSVLLEDMFVVQDMRGMGTGTMLLDSLAGWARSMNALRIQLVADRRNLAAAGFYKSKGFVPGNMAAMYRMI